jgi:hypothetical protein
MHNKRISIGTAVVLATGRWFLTDAFFHSPQPPAGRRRALPSCWTRPHYLTRTLTEILNISTSNEPLFNLVSKPFEATSPPNVEVLSNDPLVYAIHNLLSEEECHAYRQRVQEIDRPMTRSNPPEVILDVRKLWPLSILSVMAGIAPPVIRRWQDTTAVAVDHSSVVQLVQVALPNTLVAFSLSLLLAYGVVLPLLQYQARRASRTSVAVALNQLEDMEFVQKLVNRLSLITQHEWDKWEAPVVTRYDPGAMFAKHGDASPTKGSEWEDVGGQRVVTCICYLNTVEQGGETYFDRLGFGVKPEVGKVLVFFPADSIDGAADDRTIHESLPAGDVKWIVQLFGRSRRVPPPLGLPDEFVGLSLLPPQ